MDNLDDLRLAVAKALGWDGVWHWLEADTYYGWPPEATIEDDRMPLPDWPNDWNAAMELVNEFPVFGLNKAGEFWRCQCISCGERNEHNTAYCGCKFGYGETGPEAICRAFLAWKGANDGHTDQP